MKCNQSQRLLIFLGLLPPNFRLSPSPLSALEKLCPPEERLPPVVHTAPLQPANTEHTGSSPTFRVCTWYLPLVPTYVQRAHRRQGHGQAQCPPHSPHTHMKCPQNVHTLHTHTQCTHAQHTQSQHTRTLCFCTYTHQVQGEHTLHTHAAHTDSTLPWCFKTTLLLSKITAVIRSSHKGRVTDGDKLAGKKTAMHRYLKKRRANTSNLGKANRFIWEIYKEKKN